MSDLAVVFGSSLLLAYSGALMPGPMLAVVLAESPRQGARAGPLIVLGHGLLELALLALLVVGLGPVLAREGVQAVLSLVGGAVLAATAALMLVAAARGGALLEWGGGAGSRSGRRAVLAGAVSSISNPYWSLWWATIGLGLLTKAYTLGAAALVAFYLGHILGDLTWFSAVSGAIAAGRRWISARVYRGMVGAAGAALVVLAAWFLAAGLTSL
jgi:threonine/homoserine/homoserine lactone efflux protein